MASRSRLPRYYLYISDSKVISMYNQIPRRRLRRALKDTKIDVKLLAATLAEPPETRESRLAEVEDFLDKAGLVGTLDSPSAYFRGVMSMRWGQLPAPHESIVYFGGETENSIIGLSGSVPHVLGSSGNIAPGEPPPTTTIPDAASPLGLALIGGSAAPALTTALETIAGIEEGGLSNSEALLANHYRAVLGVNAKLKGPLFVAEFLAKRFTTTGSLGTAAELAGAVHGLYDPIMSIRRREKNVVLGTPVYVAQAN